MDDYFKPWHRKFGVLTLMMACVFMAGWVRSLSTIDQFTFRAMPHESFQSAIGALRWWSGDEAWNPKSEFVHWEIASTSVWTSLENPMANWRFRCMGFGIINYESGASLQFVPYWSIVLPTTLLSAHLLLSKPRVAKPVAVYQPDSGGERSIDCPNK